jgi:hypothetical protein
MELRRSPTGFMDELAPRMKSSSNNATVGSSPSCSILFARSEASIIGWGRPSTKISAPMSTKELSRLLRGSGSSSMPASGELECTTRPDLRKIAWDW